MRIKKFVKNNIYILISIAFIVLFILYHMLNNCHYYKKRGSINIKQNLQSKPNTIEKMKYLKNIYNNVPVVIFSCGNSANIDFDKFRKIQHKYVIISVKYITKKLIENGIDIDFIILSKWKKDDKFYYYPKNIPVFYIQPENKYDSNIDVILTDNIGSNHEKTFNYIKYTKNIDIIKFTDDKIKKDKILFNKGHIMLEVALPLAIHLGSKEIYTFGWDLDKNHQYFDGTFNQKEKINPEKTENKIIFDIVEMLNNNNINIYKSNHLSPIKLEYKQIF